MDTNRDYPQMLQGRNELLIRSHGSWQAETGVRTVAPYREPLFS
jgi:hypothetical protein